MPRAPQSDCRLANKEFQHKRYEQLMWHALVVTLDKSLLRSKPPAKRWRKFARLSFPTVMERISLSIARNATAASNIAAFL
jgi:hypothetical protein